MMKKLLPYLPACMLLLASCVKVEPQLSLDESRGRKAIAFSTTTEATKGDLTQTDLETNGWGLFGYYTGKDNFTTPTDVQGVLFNHRQVRWVNAAWDYSRDDDHKKEYWPMAADDKVSFFAYAPYAGFHENAGADDANGPYVTYTATTDRSAQKDLLWGTNTSGLPHRNVGLASYPDSTVDMHFRHAPAKIHFTINGATQGDNSSERTYTTDSPGVVTNSAVDRSDTQPNGTLTYNRQSYTAYNAYRTKSTTVTEVYRQNINGKMILIDRVEMTNFNRQGTLHLNNPDPFVPYWTYAANDYLDYSFSSSDLNGLIVYPDDDDTLIDGWGTTYQGVDSDPKELLKTPDNYIYMVPKTANTPGAESGNITISVYYHYVGYIGPDNGIEIRRVTTTDQVQTVRYITTGNGNNKTVRYETSNGLTTTVNNAAWTDSGTPTVTVSETRTYPNLHSEDFEGRGFKAVGSINSDILGGRDYTINLYLDGRELNLTVIPQPWDLNETVYNYDTTLNPVLQSLTYDSDFVYEVIGSNVYINNRMGKFYFKLGSGMYLYWQASLIGDDAFAFTDANGQYLRDDEGNLRTTVRGDIGNDMNYIYVKAINTASKVTSKAKLRIYLFNSENRAVVALPRTGWPFVSASYLDGEGHQLPVQEWSVVQTAN